MLLVNMLTLQHNISQSITDVGHLFHYDSSVNVTLDIIK